MRVLPAAVLLGCVAPLAAQDVLPRRPFRPGMVVTRSVRIEPGTYRAPAPISLDSALVIVRGDSITLDLEGVRLEGVAPEAEPDRAIGAALRIEGGRGVVVRGGVIRGYRFGILAIGARDLVLLDNDLGYGWKPRLFSGIAHESLVDWLSFHDNDFSYNSGLGIGLYRSSRNTIVRNRLDYDVRGYSHGFYRRGQDSAGILIYEQSSDNLVAYNSATHSGDGLFLWAGRHTMDTGEGGANDNLVFGNDFSFAPTNGMEATFSRNRFIANRVEGSDYGLWGGYSWSSEVLGNCLTDNRVGIAIEHGQDNRIERNAFAGDSTAIELWADATEPAGWGYPRHRDTRSRDARIAGNRFSGHTRLWRLENTTGLDIVDNRFGGMEPASSCDPRTLLGTAYDSLAPDLTGVPPEVPVAERARLPRSAIVVDEWGPYEGLSPKLWPVDTARARVRLRVLGPAGSWSVTERRGIAGLSAESGSTGDTLVVIPTRAGRADWALHLEYTGGATVSARGRVRPAGEVVPFAFERFEPELSWRAGFFAWTDTTLDPPAGSRGLDEVLAAAPLLARTEPRLDYQWYRPLLAGLPLERWMLEATASVDLEPGAYSLRTISDDGVRVWVDEELVIDHWTPHGSEVDYAALAAGHHELRVRYYQLGGWSELRVEIVRGSSRSSGSAGPH